MSAANSIYLPRQVCPAKTEKTTIGVGVLLYTTGYGGADSIVFNWLRAMDTSRFRMHLFTFKSPGHHDVGKFLGRAAALDTPVHQLPWHRGKPVWKAAATMARFVREFDIRILHCHNPYADLIGVLTRRLAPVRVVNTYHAFGESGLRIRILEWMDVRLHRFMDRVTAASESAKRDAVARGIPADRVQVLQVSANQPKRVSSESREHARLQFGATANDFVFLSIARLYSVKRYDIMLRAMAIVIAQHPNVRLWIAGDGPEEKSLKRLTESLGLNGHVSFLGYRDDISSLVELANAQLLTSDIEGLPIAILEGMSAGLPIVATNVGSIGEVLADGESVLLVNTGSPEQLAAAALRIIRDERLKEALGENAYRVYQERYSEKVGAASVQRLYEELAQQ